MATLISCCLHSAVIESSSSGNLLFIATSHGWAHCHCRYVAFSLTILCCVMGKGVNDVNMKGQKKSH